MHKISGAGATSQNTFTGGDPANGIPATEVTPDWLNTIQAELVYLIEQAGLTLDPANNTQLKGALDAMFAGGLVTWRGVQTASYVAAAQDGVPFDNTASANSLTLPVAPTYGEEVWFHDVAGMFKTNPLTLVRNGNLIMGLAEDSIVSTNNIRGGAKFYGATIGWRLFV